MATVAEEAEASLMQGLNLEPLLLVACGWRLEGATHPVERAATIWAFGLLWALSNLEALATSKAGVRNEITAVPRRRRRSWRQAIACLSPKCHATEFLRRIHAGPNTRIKPRREAASA